jgi:rod shape-determining protein MreC
VAADHRPRRPRNVPGFVPARRPHPDETIRRRRRAALGVVVVLVLLILVAASVGPFADVRRGISAVSGPVGDGFSKTVKPFSNLFGWIDDTITAKGKVDDVRKERDQFRDLAIQGAAAAAQNPQLLGLQTMDRQPVDLSPYKPVTARVLARSPTLSYTKITISKGAADGIKADQPVIAADGSGADDHGLIGKVQSVRDDSAVVRLLTNATMGVGAKTADGDPAGTLVASSGNPRDLELQQVPTKSDVRQNTLIVTEGTTSKRSEIESIYPPELQIGRVSRIDDEGSIDQAPHVQLLVNPRRVQYVQVLTRRYNGNR